MNRFFRLVIAMILTCGLACTVGLASADTTSAQTAKNLKCKGCVGKKQLGKNAVRSKNIKNGQVKPQDLASAAKPTGIAASERFVDAAIDLVFGADTVIREVTISAPGPGAITAMYSVFARSDAADSRVGCTVDVPGTNLGTSLFTIVKFPNSNEYATLSGVRAFPVTSQGNVTLDLICREVTGDIVLGNPSLVLLFAPNAGTLVSEMDTAPEANSSASSK